MADISEPSQQLLLGFTGYIPGARKAGLSEIQIKEALQVADKVRRVPAHIVLQTAMARIGESLDRDERDRFAQRMAHLEAVYAEMSRIYQHSKDGTEIPLA